MKLEVQSRLQGLISRVILRINREACMNTNRELFFNECIFRWNGLVNTRNVRVWGQNPS